MPCDRANEVCLGERLSQRARGPPGYRLRVSLPPASAGRRPTRLLKPPVVQEMGQLPRGDNGAGDTQHLPSHPGHCSRSCVSRPRPPTPRDRPEQAGVPGSAAPTFTQVKPLCRLLTKLQAQLSTQPTPECARTHMHTHEHTRAHIPHTLHTHAHTLLVHTRTHCTQKQGVHAHT